MNLVVFIVVESITPSKIPPGDEFANLHRERQSHDGTYANEDCNDEQTIARINGGFSVVIVACIIIVHDRGQETSIIDHLLLLVFRLLHVRKRVGGW